jgi:hypothetical protein
MKGSKMEKVKAEISNEEIMAMCGQYAEKEDGMTCMLIERYMKVVRGVDMKGLTETNKEIGVCTI